jgi:hypothetical protein
MGVNPKLGYYDIYLCDPAPILWVMGVIPRIGVYFAEIKVKFEI